MISFFALYCGVIFENGDPLALIVVVLWGMRACFLAVFRFFKTQLF